MNQEPSDNNVPAEPSANDAAGDGDELLTAHALGELTDGDRALVESRLRESPDDRHVVEQTVRLGKLLRQLAAMQAHAERSPDLREAVQAELAKPMPANNPVHLPERFPRRRFWLPLSLAASLLVTCGTLFGLMRTKHAEELVAQRDALDQSRPNDEAKSRATVAVIEMVDSLNREDGESLVTLSEGFSDDLSGVTDMSSSAPLDLTDSLSESQPSEVARGSRPEVTSSSALVGRLGGASGGQPLSSQPRKFGGEGLLYGGRGLPEQGERMAGQQQSGGQVRGRPYYAESKKGGGQQVSDPNSFGMETGVMPQQGANLGTMSPGMGTGMSDGAMPPAGPNSGAAMGGQAAGGMMGGGMMLEARAAAGQSGEYKAWYFRDPSNRSSTTGIQGKPFTLFGNTLDAQVNSESYPPLVENPFRNPADHPLSTFSIDVDTASYTNVRRFLNSRAMPPHDAVRVEELINYFQYSYPQPDGEVPFSITTDVADCPWNAEHRLMRVGLKGREVPADQRPASNLVFLLDVSGSMEAPNKLPLVKEAMYLLVDKLTENDRVAIVVYAGNSGLALPPTNGENKATIRTAISQLVANGSTNGGQGLQMAYDTAQAHFIKGGTNRVILATDGDFNVGIVDQNELVRLIEEKAKSGVFLSALGFGIGNLKDGTLEKLADKGNGNYAYIDTLSEARRVLVEQLSGTLVTIAKDVKLQIEFNPAQATEYRLIGYEDRLMPPQDFHDDRKDAGEIGAGHSVTALYEIVPAPRTEASGEPLKYQRSENLTPAASTGELATIKLRFKQPDGETSRLIEHVVSDRRPQQAEASRDMNFAAAVTAFGMLLRDSPYRGEATYQKVLSLAQQGLSSDPNGYRSEFVQLVRLAREISGKE